MHHLLAILDWPLNKKLSFFQAIQMSTGKENKLPKKSLGTVKETFNSITIMDSGGTTIKAVVGEDSSNKVEEVGEDSSNKVVEVGEDSSNKVVEAGEDSSNKVEEVGEEVEEDNKEETVGANRAASRVEIAGASRVEMVGDL